MKQKIVSRTLAVMLTLALALGMLPSFGIGALAATADEVVAAIEAIGTDAVTKANFNAKFSALQTAEAAYAAWKAEHKGEADTAISNYEALQAARAAHTNFMTELVDVEYKKYTPQDLLELAKTTSVTGASSEQMVGVKHTGAAGALYDGMVADYMGKPVYKYEEKESYVVNSSNADAAYIYENTGDANGALRYCDSDKYLIYKFDLTKFNNLCVSVNICQNYVLEAASDPSGPWTLIADYGAISGGTRIQGDSNKQVYDILFSDLGITGTGYVRLSNVDGAGGWGGAINKLSLREAVLAGDSFLFNPGDRVRLEIDAGIAGANANDAVLSATVANGSYQERASISGKDFDALEEQTNSQFGYPYRTVAARFRLPSADENPTLAENLKKNGFSVSVSSAASVERSVYRIALINETTGVTVLELTGQKLLDSAVQASAPSASTMLPKAYQSFSPAICLRAAEGSEWFSVIDMRSPYLDEYGRPLMNAGDEIQYSVDLFIEGTDSEDLPGGSHGPRLEARLDIDPADTSVGLLSDNEVIINTTEYNEIELMLDETYQFEPYKTVSRTFVIPDDDEAVAKVQSHGFKMYVGTHILPKDDHPFRIYSMTLYNLTTDTVILYADADSLSTTAAQGPRETMIDESVLGGIVGKRQDGYGDSILVNGGFETLPAGMYSYEFNHTMIGNNGANKATLSAITENGEVLTSKLVTDYHNGVYKTTRLAFSIPEETKVGFRIDLHNNTDFYVKGVTLNQMLSASEVAVQRIISAIDALPEIEALTLNDAGTVASVQRQFDRLSDDWKALVTNAQKLQQASERIAELEQQAEEENRKLQRFEDAIRNLPSMIALTKSDKSKVEEARAAYNDLTDSQKETVSSLETLETYEQRMALLMAASDEDIAAAKQVSDRIAALPPVENLAYSDKDSVTQAREAYDALSEGAAVLVLDLQKLVAAEEKLATLGPDITYGDINGDHQADASDALMALQHSVNLIKLEGDRFIAADVDQNGEVDASDALCILQYSVKLIPSLPITK